MALAGYLVLNSVRAAYVEIHTGVLICTPRLRKSGRQHQHQQIASSDCNCPAAADDDDESLALSRLSSASTVSSSDTGDEANALPRLAPRRMHRASGAGCCHKTPSSVAAADADQHDDDEEEEPVPEDEPRGRERVVQLSGRVVEVVETDLDVDAAYPFSFQVNTYTPPKRDAAGNRIGSSELVDSLVLSAMDERAKALWVKRIKHWNRFGWRETEFVNADDNDFFYLQAMMLSSEKRRRSYAAYPGSSSHRSSSISQAPRSSTSTVERSSACGSSSGAARPVRRRFYRAPAGAIGMNLLVPPPS